MLFAGFNVAEGQCSLLAGRVRRRGRRTSSAPGSPTRSATTAASTCSRSTARKLHIKPTHLKWADDWFARYGDATVFFSRMLPIIRTFISLPAGVAKMPFWRFTLLTVARLHPVGVHAHVHRQAGRRQLGELEGHPALRGLRRGRADRGRRRLLLVRGAPLPARRRQRPPDAAASQRPSRSACSRARPSCCRSHPPRTSPRCRGCSAGAWPGHPARRKELEVALHAGTALAMLLVLRGELRCGPTPAPARAARCSFAPPALVGVPARAARSRSACAGPRRAGRRPAGGRARRWPRPTGRRSSASATDAGWRDALWLGARPGGRARARASRATARRWRPPGRARFRAPGRERLSCAWRCRCWSARPR